MHATTDTSVHHCTCRDLHSHCGSAPVAKLCRLIAGNSMYFMRLLQWGLGMLRYFRSLAQPALDVIGKL